MSENKKNPIAAIVFILFVVVLPIVTVVFSKIGLDKYKDIRSEMPFLKDSIRVDFNQQTVALQAGLSNELIRGKMVFAGFWDQSCATEVDELIQGLKEVQANFKEEDQHKMLFVVHFDEKTLAQDSTWNLQSYVDRWKLDTTQWRFTKGASKAAYQLPTTANCQTAVLLDGRVSRKDTTKNYRNGPLLCAHYDLNDQKVVQDLLRHMAVIMPAKQRKKIEWKAEEELYESTPESKPESNS